MLYTHTARAAPPRRRIPPSSKPPLPHDETARSITRAPTPLDVVRGQAGALLCVASWALVDLRPLATSSSSRKGNNNNNNTDTCCRCCCKNFNANFSAWLNCAQLRARAHVRRLRGHERQRQPILIPGRRAHSLRLHYKSKQLFSLAR